MSSLVLGDSLLLDWLPSPTSHLAVWNVLIHRDTRTVAPIPRKIFQMPKPHLPLTISCYYANINNRSSSHYELFFSFKTKATTSSQCRWSPLGHCWHVPPAAQRLPRHTLTHNLLRRQSSARQEPVRVWQPAGPPLEGSDENLPTRCLSSCRQPGGCHPVAQRETSSQGMTQRWLVLRDYPLACWSVWLTLVWMAGTRASTLVYS